MLPRPKYAVLGLLVLALSAPGTARAAVPGQASEQEAGAEQGATASAAAVDPQPTNVFVSVRVDSPGDEGPVTQTSTTAVVGAAANTASTEQGSWQDWAPEPAAQPEAAQPEAAQPEAAQPAAAAPAEAPAQSNDQEASTGQAAVAGAVATQPQPVNVVVIVRVNSPGDDGPITQTSTVVVSATAGNKASTKQTAAQTQDVASPPQPVAATKAPLAARPRPARAQAAPRPRVSTPAATRPAPAPAPSGAPVATAPAPQPAQLAKAPAGAPEPAKAPARAHPSPTATATAKQRIWPRTPRELAPLPSGSHLAIAQLVPAAGGGRWSALLALVAGAFLAAGLGSSASFVLRRPTRPG